MAWKFTHAADAAAQIVVQNALFKGRKKLSSLIMPWCTYTDPQIAHVGMYEMVVESAAMNSEGVKIHDTRIIVFTRLPVPGQVKTRLIPSLSPNGAADLQRRMTEFTVQQASRTAIPMQIRFAGGTEFHMRQWLGADFEFAPQGEGDLGERMARAAKDAFEDGARKVIIVGCDCPDNRCSNMLAAIRMLDQAPCIIGPASDGGYYLIGLRTPQPELFSDIDWGTESVFRQTVAKIDDYQLLPMLNDVDEPQDIPLKISVIIPALNEAGLIGATVQAVLEGFNTEAIVVDGGSLDKTQEIAKQAGADVFISDPGRALQMNCGAKKATGDIMLFLHADSGLPTGWDRHVRETMKRPGTTLGFFRFAIKDTFPGKGLITFGANVRSRFLKKPYGDQGLFFWRNEFKALGEFPELPILEDVYLVKRAGKHGRIRCANAELLTSGRRWMKYGAVRTTLMNQAVLIAAWFGADLQKLRDTYRNGKNPFHAFLSQ